MSTRRIKRLGLHRQSGFSLIELMISIPLGILAMFAVLQIFSANIQAVSLQNAFSRVQENGRMSLELVARDIRAADYWGCIRNTNLITSHLDTSDSDYDASLNPSGQQGVSGSNDISTTTISSITVKDDTDTLTLRGAKGFSSVKIETPYMTDTSAALHISTGSGIVTGDILLIGNCTKSDLFTNTAGNTSTSGTVGHNIGNVAVTGAINNAAKDFSQSYENNALLLTPYVKTYFIGENSAGSYSLYRSVDGNASEMVRGINDLQLLYGEDTNGDGSADSYVDASSVSNMANVLTIRVELNSESAMDISGTPFERSYTTTTSIRNRTL